MKRPRSLQLQADATFPLLATMLANKQHLMPRPMRLLLALVLIYAFCWIKGWPAYYDDEELPPSQRPDRKSVV